MYSSRSYKPCENEPKNPFPLKITELILMSIVYIDKKRITIYADRLKNCNILKDAIKEIGNSFDKNQNPKICYNYHVSGYSYTKDLEKFILDTHNRVTENKKKPYYLRYPLND